MARHQRAMVYGGYGGTGRLIAALLAREPGLDVVIAGRNGRAAEDMAARLAPDHPGHAFTAKGFDITDTGALTGALADIDLLVVSAPVAEHMGAIGRVALDTGTDLLDILVRDLAAEQLLPLADAAVAAERTIVTQGGFHPGIIGPMMRAVAAQRTGTDQIHVGMAMHAQFRDANSARELIPEIAVGETRIFDNGDWRKAGMNDMRSFTFTPVFGRQSCYPLPFREVAMVARELGLKQAGIYAAGFNWFVDWLVFPLILAAHRLGGVDLAYRVSPLLYWGNRWFSPKEQSIEMRAVASAANDGQGATHSFCLFSSEPYELTAQCVIAAVRQMADGPLAAPGVWLMGDRIDPGRLFADLQAFGAKVWEE